MWVVVVALGAVLGTVVGLAVWLQLDRGPGGAAPSFDVGLYPDEPEQLEVVSVSASSQLPSDGSSGHGPELVADGDAGSAWSEGAEGPGVGETLTLELAGVSWVTSLVIRNGHQGDETTYLDHTRAARVVITFGGGATFVAELQDRSGRQALDLPEPVRTGTITIEVRDVVLGRHDDLAFTEIDVLGWRAREPGIASGSRGAAPDVGRAAERGGLRGREGVGRFAGPELGPEHAREDQRRARPVL